MNRSPSVERSAAPKRRWRPRFSLRTLLLFVLLIGSGAVLWWNWGAYAPGLTIEEERPIINAGFSPDDRTIFTNMRSANGEHISSAAPVTQDITIYDATSAVPKTKLTLKNSTPDPLRGPVEDFARFTNSGKYMFLQETSFHPSKSTLYRVDNGVKLDDDLPYSKWDQVSAADNFKTEKRGKCFQIVRLPGLEHVCQFDNVDSIALSFDEQWAAVSNEQSVQIISLKTGVLAGTIFAKRELGDPLCFSPTENTLAVETYRDDAAVVRLFEVPSGHKLAEYPGIIAFQPFSPDGHHLLIEADPYYVVEIGFSDHPVKIPSEPTAWLSNDRLLDPYRQQVFDALTGRVLWRVEHSILPSPNGEVAVDDPSYDRIINARNGETLFQFQKWRWPKNLFSDEMRVEFANHSNDFVTWLHDKDGINPASKRITLWHQKRPFEWYGIAWLPEFWIATLFAIGFVWSIARDGELLIRGATKQ